MKNIFKNKLRDQVGKGNGKLRSVLVIIAYIFEKNKDNENTNLAILTLNRYSTWATNDIAGITNLEERNKIVSSTLRLIDKLPEDHYTPSIPKLTQSNLVPPKKWKQILIGSLLTLSILTLIWLMFLRDPLGITGKWNYIVTPKQPGEKLLGRINKESNFEELYINFTGYVEVYPIKLFGNSYTMNGKRTGMLIDSTDTPQYKKNINLTFSEYSHSMEKLFFMFKAEDSDKNRGFVKLTYFSPDGKQMSGKIHYLYGDNTWKEVDVTFEKEVR